MPIRINFLAEQQEAEEMRRRDPLKRAIWFAAAIVIAGVAWCGVTQVKLGGVESTLAKKKDELAGIEKTSKVVEKNQASIKEILGKRKSLDTLARERTLWGPVLNSMQQVMAQLTPVNSDAPCPVTLLHIRANQSYVENPAAKGAGGKPGKPATATERIVITLDGRDYGTEQEQNYNKLKEKLAADSYLKDQLRKDNPVRLQSFSERQTDAVDPAKSFVAFVLEANYPERTR
jgi:hypothetical protein